MNEFMTGLKICISGDLSFTSSVTNLIDVINSIVNDPKTSVNGEQFGNVFIWFHQK